MTKVDIEHLRSIWTGQRGPGLEVMRGKLRRARARDRYERLFRWLSFAFATAAVVYLLVGAPLSRNLGLGVAGLLVLVLGFALGSGREKSLLRSPRVHSRAVEPTEELVKRLEARVQQPRRWGWLLIVALLVGPLVESFVAYSLGDAYFTKLGTYAWKSVAIWLTYYVVIAGLWIWQKRDAAAAQAAIRDLF